MRGKAFHRLAVLRLMIVAAPLLLAPAVAAAAEAPPAYARRNPSDAEAAFYLGRTDIALKKRLDRAEECLKRYLGHAPGPESAPLANARLRLGMVYQKKGNRAAARAEYQAALKLDPGLEDAKKALASLG